MQRKKLIGGGLLLLLGGILIKKAVEKNREKTRALKRVAEEGYETAVDLLLPNIDSITKLHYGPVIPRA
jgi:hypothetical protein